MVGKETGFVECGQIENFMDVLNNKQNANGHIEELLNLKMNRDWSIEAWFGIKCSGTHLTKQTPNKQKIPFDSDNLP